MSDAFYANAGYVGGIFVAGFFLYNNSIFGAVIALMALICFLLHRIHIAGIGVGKSRKTTADLIAEDEKRKRLDSMVQS